VLILTRNTSDQHDVILTGRIAQAEGSQLHVGDTWFIDIQYFPGRSQSNMVLVGVAHAGQRALVIPFGGAFIPNIAIK
jgi:hypothetical protein